jgi:hypothetical protein
VVRWSSEVVGYLLFEIRSLIYDYFMLLKDAHACVFEGLMPEIIYGQSISDRAAWFDEPSSFIAAIWEDGQSPAITAAPKAIERHPIITRLARALRSSGKSLATPISARNDSIGVRINDESPSTTATREITNLRGIPFKKETSMQFKLAIRPKNAPPNGTAITMPIKATTPNSIGVICSMHLPLR